MYLVRTVKANMDNGTITTPEQFKDDVILTFANAMKYNPPEHDVHKMAKSLNELFVQKWEKEEDSIKQKWRLEANGGTHIPSAPGQHTSEPIGRVPYRTTQRAWSFIVLIVWVRCRQAIVGH
jgi:hypothetical protein